MSVRSDLVGPLGTIMGRHSNDQEPRLIFLFVLLKYKNLIFKMYGP